MHNKNYAYRKTKTTNSFRWRKFLGETLRETASLPCVQTFVVCKFSSTRQTDRLPCVEQKTHGKLFAVCPDLRHMANNPPPTNPPTHTFNRHHLPTSPPSDPPPPLLVSTPAWSPPVTSQFSSRLRGNVECKLLEGSIKIRINPDIILFTMTSF